VLGELAGAGADFDDPAAGRHIDSAGDIHEDAAIPEEVLSEFLAGPGPTHSYLRHESMVGRATTESRGW
jgi:hypothetical protein